MTVGATHKEQEARVGVVTSYKTAPTRTITVGGTTYAYRELGPKGGIPVVFFVHLLRRWTTGIPDHRPIAKNRTSSPSTTRGRRVHRAGTRQRRAMADDAYRSSRPRVRPDRHLRFLPRWFHRPGPRRQASRARPQACPHGTGPKAATTSTRLPHTYWDMLRATVTRSDQRSSCSSTATPPARPQRRRS